MTCIVIISFAFEIGKSIPRKKHALSYTYIATRTIKAMTDSSVYAEIASE